jgi:hypothetical protein
MVFMSAYDAPGPLYHQSPAAFMLGFVSSQPQTVSYRVPVAVCVP